MSRLTHSVTHFLLITTITVLYIPTSPFSQATTQELLGGFKIYPDPSISTFQSLLTDQTNNFSLGFLRVNQNQLALVILHVPSAEPLWFANRLSLAPWSDHTQILFNGSLVISDTHGRVFWSTGTNGDRVVLLNSSNLQIQISRVSPSKVLWESFNLPSDTLVENQNFTSTMKLISSNGQYFMRLGDDFLGLYAEFKNGANQIYYKHTALQPKAKIIQGKGPILLRVNSEGYLGMYQNSSLPPVDIESFNTFQKTPNGFLRVKIEPDGNFKGYSWDGSNWVLDYQAIKDQCELPSPCGSYGLCNPESGCSCLDNRTVFNSGECFRPESGDFCGAGVGRNNFWVLRRKGIELPFKELMDYRTGLSLEQCESLCESNCTCWGSVYNNGSGFCYLVDYPIQTVVSVRDESKVGYFKVRETSGRGRMKVGFGVGLGILGGVVILFGIVGLVSYKKWSKRRRRGVTMFFAGEEERTASPGPYKDLGSASFKSIEMSNRF